MKNDFTPRYGLSGDHSPTPLCDAALANQTHTYSPVMPISLARELERENIRLREALSQITDYAEAARDLLKDSEYADLLAEKCPPIENARAALAVTPSC